MPCVWRQNLKAGLAARFRFWGRALVKGWPLAWVLVTVAALLVGFTALAAITFALHKPVLALALLLAGVVLTLGEGAYRLRAAEAARHEGETGAIRGDLTAVRMERDRALTAYSEVGQAHAAREAELEGVIAGLRARQRLRNKLMDLQAHGADVVHRGSSQDAQDLERPLDPYKQREWVLRDLEGWCWQITDALQNAGRQMRQPSSG